MKNKHLIIVDIIFAGLICLFLSLSLWHGKVEEEKRTEEAEQQRISSGLIDLHEDHINDPHYFHNERSDIFDKYLMSLEMEEEQKPFEWFIPDEVYLLAHLIEAEAGDQDLYGRRLVADVVLNRVDSPAWPNTIYDVIFQPYQFSVIFDGAFDRVANSVTQTSLDAAVTEYFNPRIDYGIIYFGMEQYNGTGFWKYGDHWFSY